MIQSYKGNWREQAHLTGRFKDTGCQHALPPFPLLCLLWCSLSRPQKAMTGNCHLVCIIILFSWAESRVLWAPSSVGKMTRGIYFSLSLAACHTGKGWFLGWMLSVPENLQVTKGPMYHKMHPCSNPFTTEFPDKLTCLSYKGWAIRRTLPPAGDFTSQGWNTQLQEQGQAEQSPALPPCPLLFCCEVPSLTLLSSPWHHSLTPFLSAEVGMFSEDPGAFFYQAVLRRAILHLLALTEPGCGDAEKPHHTLSCVCRVAQHKRRVHTYPWGFHRLTPRSGQGWPHRGHFLLQSRKLLFCFHLETFLIHENGHSPTTRPSSGSGSLLVQHKDKEDYGPSWTQIFSVPTPHLPCPFHHKQVQPSLSILWLQLSGPWKRWNKVTVVVEWAGDDQFIRLLLEKSVYLDKLLCARLLG